jgi:4-amino-4-deoxy-L-arabinose transferase-like glycosyltransferase
MGIILGGLVLRIAVFLVYRPWDPQVQAESVVINDALAYHQLAACILERASFCYNAVRVPGYPAFIALVYGLVGLHPWAVLLANTAVSLATVAVSYKLGQLLFSKRIGLAAAELIATDPAHIFLPMDMYSDVLFSFLFLCSFYFLCRGLLDQRYRDFAVSGVLMGMAALVRPIAQYYWLIPVALAMIWPIAPLARRLTWAALLGLSLLLVLSPWLARNYFLYDEVSLSWLPGQNLLFWQVGDARAMSTGQSPEAVRDELMAVAVSRGYSPAAHGTVFDSNDVNPFKAEKVAKEVARELILADPMTFASSFVRGMFRTWTRVSSVPMAKKLGLVSSVDTAPNAPRTVAVTIVGVIGGLLLGAHLLCFAFGLVALMTRPSKQIILVGGLFVVTMLYFTLAAGVLGDTRFRLPFSPLYLTIGAILLDRMFIRGMPHEWRIRLASTGLPSRI